MDYRTHSLELVVTCHINDIMRGELEADIERRIEQIFLHSIKPHIGAKYGNGYLILKSIDKCHVHAIWVPLRDYDVFECWANLSSASVLLSQ
jgi:hypothetical protein